LLNVTEEKVKDYITNLQPRQRKWDNHPYHPPIAESLCPFTVRKDVKILRGFGTWLAREGFANPFEELDIPKYMVDVLTHEEISKIFDDLKR
jgi:hypothetical protein